MSRPSRLPLILLGLMTLVSFGGPFLIVVLLGGGERSGWPPDRPIEWIGFGLVMTAFTASFSACLTVGWWHGRSSRAETTNDVADRERAGG